MRKRYLTSFLGVVAAVAGLVLLLPPVPLAGQTSTAANTATAPPKASAEAKAKPSAPTKAYSPPKTSWGDPDITGVFDVQSALPLQRPAKVGDKSEFTDEEVQQLESANEEAAARAASVANGSAPPPPREEYATGNYNQEFFDRPKLRGDRRTSLIVDPPDGRIPALVLPLSKERQRERVAWTDANLRFIDGFPASWTESGPPLRCITRQDRPPIQGMNYNGNAQIFQGPGYVAVSVEMRGSARIIPLDGRPALGKDIKTWVGEPRGHWEGNTLVVESSNFRPEAVWNYQGGQFGTNRDAVAGVVPVAETYHMTERFTRVADDVVNYEYTVSDPQTWVRPWTAMVPWHQMDKAEPLHQMYEYACHEDNYDAVHMLQGARIREKSGDGPKAPGPNVQKFYDEVGKP